MILDTLFVVIVYSALMEGVVLLSVLRGLVKKARGTPDLISTIFPLTLVFD